MYDLDTIYFDPRYMLHIPGTYTVTLGTGVSSAGSFSTTGGSGGLEFTSGTTTVASGNDYLGYAVDWSQLVDPTYITFTPTNPLSSYTGVCMCINASFGDTYNKTPISYLGFATLQPGAPTNIRSSLDTVITGDQFTQWVYPGDTVPWTYMFTSGAVTVLSGTVSKLIFKSDVTGTWYVLNSPSTYRDGKYFDTVPIDISLDTWEGYSFSSSGDAVRYYTNAGEVSGTGEIAVYGDDTLMQWQGTYIPVRVPPPSSYDQPFTTGEMVSCSKDYYFVMPLYISTREDNSAAPSGRASLDLRNASEIRIVFRNSDTSASVTINSIVIAELVASPPEGYILEANHSGGISTYTVSVNGQAPIIKLATGYDYLVVEDPQTSGWVNTHSVSSISDTLSSYSFSISGTFAGSTGKELIAYDAYGNHGYLINSELTSGDNYVFYIYPQSDMKVRLYWEPWTAFHDTFDSISIFRKKEGEDYILLTSLPGTDIEYTDTAPSEGMFTYKLVGYISGEEYVLTGNVNIYDIFYAMIVPFIEPYLAMLPTWTKGPAKVENRKVFE